MRITSALLACLLGSLATAAASSTAATAADGAAALASFQSLLEGLGHRDKAAMLAHSLPGGHAVLMRQGKPLQMTLDELAERVSKPGDDRHEERIVDPLVRVDDDIAIVWARFEFLVNGKVEHCGRDVATLVKVDARWLVAAIQDTATDTCGARR